MPPKKDKNSHTYMVEVPPDSGIAMDNLRLHLKWKGGGPVYVKEFLPKVLALGIGLIRKDQTTLSSLGTLLQAARAQNLDVPKDVLEECEALVALCYKTFPELKDE